MDKIKFLKAPGPAEVSVNLRTTVGKTMARADVRSKITLQ